MATRKAASIVETDDFSVVIKRIIKYNDKPNDDSAFPPVNAANWKALFRQVNYRSSASFPAAATTKPAAYFKPRKLPQSSETFKAVVTPEGIVNGNQTTVLWHKTDIVGELKAKLEPLLCILSPLMELKCNGRVMELDERHIFKYTSSADCALTFTELPLRLRLRLPTGDVKIIQEAYISMTVSALKLLIENAFGIPIEQLRLSYLEERDLMDTRRLYYYEVIPNSIITVHLWPGFGSLYKLVIEKDVFGVMRELHGSFEDERAWSALYLAAFRGNVDLCRALLEVGIRPDLGAERNVYEQGPLPFSALVTGFKPVRKGSGKTPIHAAAGEGHMDCLTMMIELVGAAYYEVDHLNQSPEEWAKRQNQTVCGDYLSFTKWRSRTSHPQ